MNFSPEVLDALADALAKAGYLSTQSQIDARVREIAAQFRLGAGRRSVGATTGHDDVAVAACAAIHLAATQEVVSPWIEVIHVPPRGRNDYYDDDGTRWTPL